jgi:serine phosphatase RsbU (regulator of sigma subunit)
MSIRKRVETAARRAWDANRTRLQPLLPLGMIAGGIVLDVTTPGYVTSDPLLAAAPPVAAALSSVRTTALISGAAVISGSVLTVIHDTGDHTHRIWELLSIVLLSIIALVIAQKRSHSQIELEAIRSVAETVQRAVLPVPDRRVGPLTVAVRYEAADAEAQIGGDLYAVQDTPYGVRMIVGDVRGKGMGAVAAVALLLGAFRETADSSPTLGEVVRRLDGALEREGVRRADSSEADSIDSYEGFTTALIAEVSADGSMLRMANRGHPAPLLLEPGGAIHELQPAEYDVPLGTAGLLNEASHIDTFCLPEGAMLLMFTDGVTEARDADGVFYDPLARLSGCTFRGPDQLLDRLVSDVQRHTGGPVTDDLALLALARGPLPFQGGGRSGRATAVRRSLTGSSTYRVTD